MKNRFGDLLAATNRGGMGNLLSWLETTDFYTAPASTQHHGAKEGGLLEHSLAVYDKLLIIMQWMMESYDPNKAAIVALLHDICKANFYTVSTRNVKVNGVWEQVPYYAIEDKMPLGHGEKSVILIQQYIRLTAEEMMAIRWHMGGWEDSARGYGGQQAQSAAMKDYPLIAALHMADLAATNFDGK